MSTTTDWGRASIKVMGSKDSWETQVIRCDARFRTVIAVAPPKLPIRSGTLATHPDFGPILILRVTRLSDHVFREVLTGATLVVQRKHVPKAALANLKPPLFDK